MPTPFPLLGAGGVFSVTPGKGPGQGRGRQGELQAIHFAPVETRGWLLQWPRAWWLLPSAPSAWPRCPALPWRPGALACSLPDAGGGGRAGRLRAWLQLGGPWPVGRALPSSLCSRRSLQAREKGQSSRAAWPLQGQGCRSQLSAHVHGLCSRERQERGFLVTKLGRSCLSWLWGLPTCGGAADKSVPR